MTREAAEWRRPEVPEAATLAAAALRVERGRESGAEGKRERGEVASALCRWERGGGIRGEGGTPGRRRPRGRRALGAGAGMTGGAHPSVAQRKGKC